MFKMERKLRETFKSKKTDQLFFTFPPLTHIPYFHSLHKWSCSSFYDGLSGKSPAIVNIRERCVGGIDVTWQPRTVDWNVHVWTMMPSVY